MPEQRQQHLGAVQLYRTISHLHLHKERQTNRTPSVVVRPLIMTPCMPEKTDSPAKLFKERKIKI